jgi:putative DNA primase/helicase
MASGAERERAHDALARIDHEGNMTAGEKRTGASSEVRTIRAQLFSNEYGIVPVLTGQKKTDREAWPEQARHQTAEDVAEVDPAYMNTGILCDGLRAVDIDCDDPDVAARVRSLAVEMLGPAPIRTRSDSPRVLLLYCAAEGSPHKQVVEGQDGKIEVLGHGQQFVAFGRHPDGDDYEWPDDSPLTTSRDLLPTVTEQQMEDFLAACRPVVGAPSTPQPPHATAAPAGKQAVTKGGRTPYLRSLIGTMINRGMTLQAITAAVLAENTETCTPPLPEAKVQRMAADMVQRYPAGTTPAPAFPFQVTDEGVFWQREPHNPSVRLSARVDVIAETRDANGENWGRQLEWRDSEERKHPWAMPMELLAGDAAAVRGYLLSGGLSFMTTNRQLRERFIEYLQTAPVERRARCVGQIGWHDGRSYVLPETVISPGGAEAILYQTPHDAGHYWDVRGTAAEWREKVGSPCSGNSRLLLPVSAAFTGPLLSLVGGESGGFHFHGATSTGKTTALIVGGSVCGGGGPLGFVQSWRATTNGMEAVAASHNDASLFLDEMSQADPRDVAMMAYLVGNGQGKARMNTSIAPRKRLSWKVLSVSAGELTVAEHAATVGQRTRGGAGVRLLNIEADAGAEMGMFEDLHGAASPDVFANQLKAAALRYYGAVFIKYIGWLVRNRDKAAEAIRKAQKKFQESVVPQDAAGEVRRAAERFGLIGAAGELATRMGLTGWRKGEAFGAMKGLFAEWLSNRGTAGPSDADAGVNAVRAYILQHGVSRFQSMQPGSRSEIIRDRVGFVRVEGGSPKEYYIFLEAFRSEVCKGHSYRDVLKALDARGFLRREPPNMTVKPNLPGVGRTRVYCVLGSILEGDES